MTQPPPELPGYRFERLLGSGGYSDVYLYRQQLPTRQVAVKVLKAAELPAEQRARFTAEANAMAGLADHPNIVSVFSAALSSDGRPYIVMQYYARPNLAVRAASERLGVAEVLRVGIQIASAVETAHRAGILHRDIKPANLLISQYGAPGLTDFGIAGQLADLDDDEDTGVSVPWAAPEVLYATGPTSIQSDVYSLAATLWHLLVGRSPFEERSGDNSTFALMRRVRDTPPPPTGRPDVPASLDRLLRQSMNKDPRGRPVSAIEFARRLQTIEAELQLPRTEFVATTEAGAGPAAPGTLPTRYTTAPSTIARPVAMSPQTPLTYRAANPDDVGRAPPTGTRPDAFAGQPGDASTADGPAGPGSNRATATQPGRTGRRSPVPLIVAAVVMAGLAVGGGILLSSGSSDTPKKPVGTISELVGTQDAGLPGEQIPPGVPTVTGSRDAQGRLVFRWTYSAAQAGDTFLWRETGGAPRQRAVTEPVLTLPRPAKGSTVCVQVRVVRADGGFASATFSPKGCVEG